MIPSTWLKGLFGFLVKGNGIGDGTEYVHANQVVLSDGVTGSYNEIDRIVTVTSEGAGSTGPAGPGYYATSATSLLVATGEKTFTTQAGLAYIAGSRARAVSAADSANYMEGVVTGYTGTTFVLLVDIIGGSGTHTDWRISLSGALGPTGASGPAGPGLFTTATDNRAVGTGYYSFNTVAAGLAYVAGMRLRVISRADPANWLEGIVDSYSSELLSLTLTSDRYGGSGYHTDWDIVAVGDVGATGAGVAATSASSTAIGTGANRTFVVQTGLAYFPGMRLKAISRADAANWIEGPIVLYSGNEVTIYAERSGGSGTHTDWDIGVAGDVGATGATGPVGVSTFGPFGYTAGSSGSTAPGWCSTNPGADLNHAGRALVQVQMPRAGMINGWSIHHGAAVAMNIDYDIEINGVGLEVWGVVYATEQDSPPMGLSIVFAKGDLLSIYVTPCAAAYAKIYLEVTWDSESPY